LLKRGICLLVITIICTVSLCGCQNSGIEYNIGFSDKVVFGSKEAENGGITVGLRVIVKSFNELRDLCEEWSNPAFEEDNDGYGSELSEKIRGYNEEFFENKTLIINSSVLYNSAREPRVEKLTIEGDELIIEISLKRGTYNDIAESWLFIIEVNQTDIQGITNISIENTTRSKYQ
jgi:hypothetical protein